VSSPLGAVKKATPHTDVKETFGRADRPGPPLQRALHRLLVLLGSQIVEAQWASRERNLERFVTKQPPYSVLVPGVREDVLPIVQRHGMGT
jgi:hypothetical protein